MTNTILDKRYISWKHEENYIYQVWSIDKTNTTVSSNVCISCSAEQIQHFKLHNGFVFIKWLSDEVEYNNK